MSFDKPFLNFVRAKASFPQEFGKGNQKKKNDDIQGTLSGIEAKEFYNSVITSSSDNNDSCTKGFYSKTKRHEQVIHEETNFIASTRSSRKRSSSFSESRIKPKERLTSEKGDREGSPSVASRLVNKFLQYAQEGHLRDMKRLLSEITIDIYVKDQFLWTAIMCAAHSGHTDVVRYLLDKGALWKGMVNSQGKTALDLARAANHSAIIELLEGSELNTVIPRSHKSRTLSAVGKPFWCPVCKEEFTEDEKRHQSSTVHQFNCQHKAKGPYFSISEDNPGYKLMVKSGWDEEKGLGPEGEGRKFPIKTVLKRDRYGLGNEMSSKARVTHFGPNDKDAVKIKKKEKKDGRKETNRTLSKKQKRLKESKEKVWERNMRIYMNS